MLSLSCRLRKHFDALFTPSRHGFLAEALVFAHLRASPVIRAPEFSPVDGAIYLNFGGDLPDLDIERVERAALDDSAQCCINFDIKTRRLLEASEHAGGPRGTCWAANEPTRFQRQNCAFILVVFNAALGPSRDWLALVPIEHFEGLLCKAQMVYNNVLSCAAVDPAMMPYVFPIEMVSLAVASVARAAQGQVPYLNPWSGVTIAKWEPARFPSSAATLGSRSSSAQVSSSRVCLEWIREAVRMNALFKYDLNDVQPLLGDFILHRHGEELLFEHKANQFRETPESVTFHLTSGDIRRNPFHPLRLWDYIMWHNYDSAVAYCLPRNHVPDHFCTETSSTLRVPRSSLVQWRLVLDEDGRWLTDLLNRIILPYHSAPVLREHLLPGVLKEVHLTTDGLRGKTETEVHIEDEWYDGSDPSHGRLRNSLDYGLHGLICLLQDLCAKSGEGVILPLWRHCPAGNYAVLDWSWTPSEQARYWHSRELPVGLIDRRLRPQTTVCAVLVTAVFYTDEQGGSLKTPRMQHRYRTQDQRDEYFLTRQHPFILLADPSPAELSTGRGNCDHPYLMIPSPYLERPQTTDFRRPRPIRYWMREARDPFCFAMPVRQIHEHLKTIMSLDLHMLHCTHLLPPVPTSSFKRLLIDILQEQEEAAGCDAQNASQLDAHQRRYRHLIQPEPDRGEFDEAAE